MRLNCFTANIDGVTERRAAKEAVALSIHCQATKTAPHGNRYIFHSNIGFQCTQGDGMNKEGVKNMTRRLLGSHLLRAYASALLATR